MLCLFVITLFSLLVLVRSSNDGQPLNGSFTDVTSKGLNISPSLPSFVSQELHYNESSTNGSLPHPKFILYSFRPIPHPLNSRHRREVTNSTVHSLDSNLTAAGSNLDVNQVLAPVPVAVPGMDWKRVASPILISMLMPFNVGANAAAVGALAPAVAGQVGESLGNMVSIPIMAKAESIRPMPGLNAGFALPLLGVDALNGKLRTHDLNVIN